MWESTSMILLDGDGQWDGDGKVIAHWTQLKNLNFKGNIIKTV